MELRIGARKSGFLYLILIFIVCSCYVVAVSGAGNDLILTQNQQAALNKFRQRVISRLPLKYMKEDDFLVRWLKAKNFHVDQAEQLLNKNLKWRKVHKIDTILEEDWSDMTEKYPYHTDTVSKSGNPILAGNIGQWDIRAAALSGKMPRLIRYLDKGIEEVKAKVRKFRSEGKNVTQFDFLANMENYNIVQHGCLQCIQFYLAFVSNYENNNPVTADNIIMFNAPPVFETILRAVRPLMSPITRKNLKVYGEDKEQWSKVLLSIADKDQLLPEYGGTRKVN